MVSGITVGEGFWAVLSFCSRNLLFLSHQTQLSCEYEACQQQESTPPESYPFSARIACILALSGRDAVCSRPGQLKCASFRAPAIQKSASASFFFLYLRETNLDNSGHHLQIVLAIRHHHEVISVQLVGETMKGQEAHARCQLQKPGCR